MDTLNKFPFDADAVADFSFDLTKTDAQGKAEFKNLFNSLVQVSQNKTVRVERWTHPAGEDGKWDRVGGAYLGNQVEVGQNNDQLAIVLQDDGSVTRIPAGRMDGESNFQSYGNDGLAIGWNEDDGSRSGLTFVPENFAPDTRPIPEPSQQ
ncbi:hypothetical protein HYV64_03640 [Candidatus Shapirobacteria bacterium]|nr:hypothetical protein [Candidatus Shapirobacteria bacterium]